MAAGCMQSAFPLIKIGTLLVKQVSKPLARAIQRKAKEHKFVRTYLCMPPAQFYHWVDTTIKMRLMGLGISKKVVPLNEEMAIELGAELIGEIVIFSVAAGTLLFEYKRSSIKEARLEQIQNDKLVRLDTRITDLGLMLEQQDTKIRELTRLIESTRGEKGREIKK